MKTLTITSAAAYAEQEYRLTKAELAQAAKKIRKGINATETFEFTGDLRVAAAGPADPAVRQPRRQTVVRRNRRGQRRATSAA